MDNKVLIKLLVPEINQKYDLYLPINKKIGSIVKLLSKAINDFNTTNINFAYLYNGKTGELYDYGVLVINTNIRNGSRLIITR